MFEIITVDELIKRLGRYNHRELAVHHTWRPNHEIYVSRPDGDRTERDKNADRWVGLIKWILGGTIIAIVAYLFGSGGEIPQI